MRLTVLGSGAASPRPGGACSGFLVEGGGATVWLEAGNGTFSRLQQHVSYRDLDAVVMSHRHGDHVADLIPLMYTLAFEETLAPLPVYAPEELRSALLAFLGESSREMFERVFDYRSIIGSFEAKGLKFETFRTAHPAETYGMRITDGDRVLAYTADTGEFPQLPEACRGVDLLVSEATFVGDEEVPPGLHLSAKQAGTVAKTAGAGRLLLTHVWPTHDPATAVREARSTFDGPVDHAEEGKTYEV